MIPDDVVVVGAMFVAMTLTATLPEWRSWWIERRERRKRGG